MDSGHEPLTVWTQSREGITHMVDGLSHRLVGSKAIRKAYMDTSGVYLVLLDESHCLSLWDAKTFVYLPFAFLFH
jgi:hypothetical protein